MPDITVRDYLNTGRELPYGYKGMGLNEVMVHGRGERYQPKMLSLSMAEKAERGFEHPRIEDYVKVGR